MKKEIIINNKKYQVNENVNDALDGSELSKKITDYYDEFDYIVGDWAYGKLRLKGFNKKGNKNFKEYNDIKKVDEYIKEYCAYGCKYFILEKL